MNLDTVHLVRGKAWYHIQNDPELLKLWNNSETDHGRELIMTWVIFTQTFERGYNDGWLDGEVHGQSHPMNF